MIRIQTFLKEKQFLLDLSDSCFGHKRHQTIPVWRLKRQISDPFSLRESCSDYRIALTISHRGCRSLTLRAVGCHGTCHSRSVPEWDFENEELQFIFKYCTWSKNRDTYLLLDRNICPHRQSYKSGY